MTHKILSLNNPNRQNTDKKGMIHKILSSGNRFSSFVMKFADKPKTF